MENDVGQQVECLVDILAQHSGMKRCILFGRKGIEVATEALQPTHYLPGLAPFGAFEGHVLAKVSQSLLAFLFVA